MRRYTIFGLIVFDLWCFVFFVSHIFEWKMFSSMILTFVSCSKNYTKLNALFDILFLRSYGIVT